MPTTTETTHLGRHGWYEQDGKYNLDKLPEQMTATCRFERLSFQDAMMVQECIDKLLKVES